MRGITWVRCFIDNSDNRAWVALRGTPTGFDVLISVLKQGTITPMTQTSKANMTIGEAADHFMKCCGFYSDKGYRIDAGYETMLKELLGK